MVSGSPESPRGRLAALLQAGLAAVEGEAAVRTALARPVPGPATYVIAVGKAAEAMSLGVSAMVEDKLAGGLVVTPARYRRRHDLPQGLRWLPGGHPLPDADSLRAGEAVAAALPGLKPRQSLLLLLSGGASAMLEQPAAGIGLAELVRVNEWLQASGLDIHQVNAVRARLSRLKGGGLLRLLPDEVHAEVLLISDVPEGDPAVVGSGPLYPLDPPLPPGLPDWLGGLLETAGPRPWLPFRRVPHRVIADNDACRAAVLAWARALGMPAFDHGETLAGDAAACGGRLVRTLRKAPPGVHVWGGETTVCLPAAPGRGGRNQQLALAAARALAGQGGLWLLAAGTDGIDGNSEDAGALVDGDTLARGQAGGCDADDCLARADAGRFLEAAGDLVHTGPTGTNVMDVVIAFKKG